MDSQAAKGRLAYAPALDGLRALAVLAVMFYHGGVAWAGGGFLGVDVFFVLSGFLITTLLLLEFEASSALNLKDFWVRRARRLLPALFVVLLAVLIYAAFLEGQAAAAVRADTAATLFYVSNWWFIFSDNSYFEQFSDPSPLTHTWSLAIEEQWYLLLPLLLALLLPRVRSRRWWIVGFTVLALASALVMSLMAPAAEDLSRSYYGTDTRLQALLVGAALAALFTPGVLDRLRGAAGFIAPVALLGLLAMLWAVGDQDRWMYHGGFLLVALLAAALVGSVLAHPDGAVARMFSLGPLVWIGTISYGLYLWHWPVYVVLSPGRTGLAGFWLLVLRFAVTFALATASYYLIESPIRRGALTRMPGGQRLALVVGAPLAIIGLILATAAVARPPAPDSLEAVQQAATRAPVAEPEPSGTSGTDDDQVSVLMVGDSVALSLVSAYQPGTVENLTVLPATLFGCGVAPYQASVNGVAMPYRQECQDWIQQQENVIATSGADVGVLFAGPWELYDRWIDGREVRYTDPDWQEATVGAYERILRNLGRSTSRQVAVLGTCHGAPEMGLPDAAMYQAGRHPDIVNDARRQEAVNSAMREAVRRSGLQITIIDPNPFLCAGGYRAQIAGQPMHTDGVHFTTEGAQVYWGWLGPRLVRVARSPSATPSSPGR